MVTPLPNITPNARSRPWANAGPPKSGTAGTFAGQIGVGDLLLDTTNGVLWFNEGTKASPYYSPAGEQPGLISIVAPHFAGSEGKALSDTATSVVLGPHGWTVLGDGVHEADSGAVVQAAAEGIMPTIRLTTSDAIGDLAGLCTPVVGSAGIYQPDANKLAIIDVDLTNVSDLADRIVLVGFAGIVAVGETDVVVAATTITTLNQNDVACLYMDATATDVDRIIAAFSKAGTPATQDFSVLTELNTGVNMAVAATAQRFRVEVDEDGGVRMFIDKVLVFTGAAATLAVDQELNALLYISPTTTTNVSADILRAAFHMHRAA